jgi:CHASE3 domain sensor protein
MTIFVVRAFVQLRELLASNKELSKWFDQLEASIQKKLTSHDSVITAMLSAIRQLMHPQPEIKNCSIGFVELEERKKS